MSAGVGFSQATGRWRRDRTRGARYALAGSGDVAEFAARAGEVVGALHAHPVAGVAPAEALESDGKPRRDAGAGVDDALQRDAGNAEARGGPR